MVIAFAALAALRNAVGDLRRSRHEQAVSMALSSRQTDSQSVGLGCGPNTAGRRSPPGDVLLTAVRAEIACGYVSRGSTSRGSIGGPG
jgi:hypothetical protein